MAHPAVEHTDRSLGAVVKDVAANLERLVRSELRLIKAQTISWANGMARGSVMLVAGALLGQLAVGLLLLAAISRLSQSMRPWQATLVVAGGTVIVAALAIGGGLTLLRKQTDPFESPDAKRGD